MPHQHIQLRRSLCLRLFSQQRCRLQLLRGGLDRDMYWESQDTVLFCPPLSSRVSGVSVGRNLLHSDFCFVSVNHRRLVCCMW